MSTKPKVVVGGGIIGLVSALAALELGPVTIFDPGIGSGATYAAAGMLSPGAELLAGEAHALEDAAQSLADWPALLDVIKGPPNIFFPRTSSLLTGFSRGDSEEVKRLTAFAQKSSLEMEHVTRLSNSSLFSGISPRFTQGVLFPDDGFVDVEKLVEALLANLQLNGVSIITECVVAIEGGTTAVVRTEKGRYEFDSGILCTGSQKSLVDTAAAKSFRSVRGVTLRLRRRELVPPRMVRALIDGRSIYVVDRPNGEVIIGASSDESDERYVDAQAVADLLRLGIQLCPSLDDAEFLEARSGLRPVGPSGQSFLERLNGSWAWHTGYYRHGVLMAPLAYRRAQEFWND